MGCVCGCVQVCAAHARLVRGCAQVYVDVCVIVRGCTQVCVGVCRCAQVCMDVRGCVWDEFSEFLLENRFLTSADFNTYPIRILFIIIAPAIYS